MKKVCEVQWMHHRDGRVTLVFKNCITGEEDVRTYKTASAAKGAETRFSNRMARVYG